jgi:hypothetical protein
MGICSPWLPVSTDPPDLRVNKTRLKKHLEAKISHSSISLFYRKKRSVFCVAVIITRMQSTMARHLSDAFYSSVGVNGRNHTEQSREDGTVRNSTATPRAEKREELNEAFTLTERDKTSQEHDQSWLLLSGRSYVWSSQN